MLNLTKYQQKINKTMVVFANYVFVIWLKKLLAFIIFGNKTKKIIALFVAIFGIILLLWQFHFKEVLSGGTADLKKWFVGNTTMVGNINAIIYINVLNDTYEKRGHYEMVEKVGLYWHFVDLVWVFVFTFFYLL